MKGGDYKWKILNKKRKKLKKSLPPIRLFKDQVTRVSFRHEIKNLDLVNQKRVILRKAKTL